MNETSHKQTESLGYALHDLNNHELDSCSTNVKGLQNCVRRQRNQL